MMEYFHYDARQQLSKHLQFIINKRGGMVNAVAVIVPIVVAIIIIAVSVYLFSVYCHPEERGVGNEVFPKILVILSQTLAWGQLLLLPLDQAVDGGSEGSTYYLVYYILYPVILVLVAFLNPFAMFLYQSDENEPYSRRLFWSFLYALIVAAIWIAFIFISYVWLGVYSIGDTEYRMDASLYILLILSFVGWVLLVFNGAIGLVYLPYDLISYFANEPKELTTEQAFAKKNQLQAASAELITEGEKLKVQEQQLRQVEGGWFSKRRANSKFEQIFDAYKQKIAKLQQEYQWFNSELQRKSGHPVVYIVALIFGILSSIVSLFWFIQMIGAVSGNNSQPSFSFMDSWFSNLTESSAGFVATLLYGILVLYMQICIVKGNCVFGIRIPFLVKVHPMVVNKTYMNSMLFNCNLMLLASSAISIQSLWAFPKYFNPASCFLSEAYNSQVLQLPLFGSFYGRKIYMIAMVALFLLVVVIVVGKAVWQRCKSDKKKKQAEKNDI